MCAPSIDRTHRQLSMSVTLLRVLQLLGKAGPKPLGLPVTIGTLSPHMRRDLGLQDQAAVRWSDSIAYIDRDSRRP